MQATYANAVTAEDLINQMIHDGTMHQNEDGSFAVMGADGQERSYRPNDKPQKNETYTIYPVKLNF